MKFLGMSSESTRSRAKTRRWPTLQKGDLQAKLHASELRNFQMFENASDHSPVRGEDVAFVFVIFRTESTLVGTNVFNVSNRSSPAYSTSNARGTRQATKTVSRALFISALLQTVPS